MKCAVQNCLNERIGPIWCNYHSPVLSVPVLPPWEALVPAAPKLVWLSDREENHTNQWAHHEQFTAHIQRVAGFWHFAVWTEAVSCHGPELEGRTNSLLKAQELCEAFVA
jgi:hypothetical protein